MHQGIDIDCVTGDPEVAAEGGVVESVSNDPAGYGLYVVINHSDGLATVYAHASKTYVSAGQEVGQGQTVSACGATGDATGDHLHFEVRVNGVPQDPLSYLP